MPEVKLAPTVFDTIGPFAISNALISTLLVSLFLIIMGLVIRFKLSPIPGRLQMSVEMIMLFWLDKLEVASGSTKRARAMLPIIMTVFLLLLFGNQLMLIPFLGSITLGEANLFKAPAAHYSLPIALILMFLGAAHIVALTVHPFRYVGNFFKFHVFFKIRKLKDIPMACIEFFLGLMDIVGELAKFISTATRLFGNMFAGEIIVVVISSLLFATQFIVPIPFIVLGIMSGLVQAFVFTMLLTLFVNSTINSVMPPKELETEATS